jgi:hypothetical protein
MKRNIKEIFVDENGTRWKITDEIDCPRKLRKVKYTVSFETQFEIEMAELPIPHRHRIGEKERCEYIKEHEKILHGEIKDLGYYACRETSMLTTPKAKVIQKTEWTESSESVIDNPTNRHFFETLMWLFQEQKHYVAQHLPEQLEAVFFKLWEESQLDFYADRESQIKKLGDSEMQAARKRLTRKKSRREAPTEQEREKFINDCREQIEILSRDRQKINQKNVASRLFPKNLNSSVKMFSRKLEGFNLSFEELIKECQKKDNILP